MRDRNGVPPGFDELAQEFEILGELGRGGMAVVYHARECEGGRQVALKVIRARYMEDEEVLARFAREVRTLIRLQHPHIVPTYAVRQLSEGSLVLVMEHIPGRTLREVIRWQGPLPIAQVEQVLRDMAEALAYAHRRGIVHRDVKPDNIFLHEKTGAALLSDFGIAKSSDSDTRLTMTGVALGTPAYMSPEQIDGHSVDGRSDLYSLGVVGWEMLSGRRAWEGETLYGIIYRQKHEELRALRELRSDVPEHLELLVEGALLKDPVARWASAEDVLAQLASGGLPGRRARRTGERRRGRVVANVLAAREQRQTLQEEEERTVRYRRLPAPTSPPGPQTRLPPREPALRAAGLVLFVAAGTWLLATAGFRDPASELRPGAAEALPAADGGAVASMDFLSPNSFALAPYPFVGDALGEFRRADVRMVLAEELAPGGHESASVPAAAEMDGAAAVAQRSAAEREPSPAEAERAAPEHSESARRPRQTSPPSRGSGLLGEPVDTAARRGPPADDPGATGFDSGDASESASARRSASRRDCSSSRFGAASARDECALPLAVGQSFQLSASRGSLRGSLGWGTRASGQAGWRSSNPAVATVDANGVVQGVSPGRVTITATAPGMGGIITVVVVAAPSPEP